MRDVGKKIIFVDFAIPLGTGKITSVTKVEGKQSGNAKGSGSYTSTPVTTALRS